MPIVWSTGWHFLGATYSVAVIQPFVFAFVGQSGGQPAGAAFINANTTCTSPPLGGAFCAWQSMFINTVWQPLDLSWNLGSGWFTSVYFSFQAPEGTKVVGIANPDFWTFSPGAAISYLSANWNLSANFVYNIYTASQGTYGNLGARLGRRAAPLSAMAIRAATSSPAICMPCIRWASGSLVRWAILFGKPPLTGRVATGCAGLAAVRYSPGLAAPIRTSSASADSSAMISARSICKSGRPTRSGHKMPLKPAGRSGTRLGFRLWAPEAPKPLVAKN